MFQLDFNLINLSNEKIITLYLLSNGYCIIFLSFMIKKKYIKWNDKNKKEVKNFDIYLFFILM
jgi:hypothetical protein